MRGVSPLVSALNPLRDVYENFSFALAKAKVSQLFAMAFYRDSPDAVMPVEADPEQGSLDADVDGIEEPRGFQAFMKSDTRYIDLNPNERAEVIESKQTVNGISRISRRWLCRLGQVARHPVFVLRRITHKLFGSRAAWLHYERSCKDKRDDQIEMRRNYTQWKLQQWIASGRLVLPAGVLPSNVAFEWVPRGMPWGSVQGNTRTRRGDQSRTRHTAANLPGNRHRLLRQRFDAIQKAIEYAEQKSVPLEFAMQDEPTEPSE